MEKQRRDPRKLRELILYVAWRTRDDPNCGAVKLNKILYHAEFRAYRELGHSISGTPYVALEYGPAPIELRPIRKNLEITGDARVVQVPMGPQAQDRIVAQRDADTTIFTREELEITDAVIKELWSMHWSTLSVDTHRLPGWLAARPTQAEIPYETAFLSNDITEEDRQRAQRLTAEYGWA